MRCLQSRQVQLCPARAERPRCHGASLELPWGCFGVLLCSLLLSTGAGAEGRSLEGTGRIAVAPGFRHVPNAYFAAKAAAAGAPLTAPSPGGPALTASFGYGATDWIDASIDLLGAYESFALEGHERFHAFVYGALLGVRLSRYDAPFEGWVPYVGAQAGPMLSTVTSASLPGGEHLSAAISANAGICWLLTPRWGLVLDVRWLLMRTYVSGIAGLNTGGFTFSLGVMNVIASSGKPDSIDSSF